MISTLSAARSLYFSFFISLPILLLFSFTIPDHSVWPQPYLFGIFSLNEGPLHRRHYALPLICTSVLMGTAGWTQTSATALLVSSTAPPGVIQMLSFPALKSEGEVLLWSPGAGFDTLFTSPLWTFVHVWWLKFRRVQVQFYPPFSSICFMFYFPIFACTWSLRSSGYAIRMET